MYEMCYRNVWLSLAVLGCAAALPTVSKTVILEKQIPSSNEISHGGLGASASWGPYSAGAGLGGGAGGGGLFAGAASPHGNAGAGLGGGGSSSASASASAEAGATGAGGVGVKPMGPGFFDKIFNIPISILQSVNTNLNANGRIIPHRERIIPRSDGPQDEQLVYVRYGRRGGIKKRVYVNSGANAGAGAGGVTGAGAHADAGAQAGAGAGAQAGASAGAGAGVPLDRSGASASASASAGNGGATVVQGGVRKNYDAIFNIPITALRSVNDFLNGK